MVLVSLGKINVFELKHRFSPIFVFSAVMAGLLLVAFCRPAAANTIIFYDDTTENQDGVIHANMMLALVSHFDALVQIQNVAAYQAGEMAAYDYIIYMGTVDHALPAAFLNEAASGEHRLFWMHQNIWLLDQNVGSPTPYGFEYVDYMPGDPFAYVEYKDRLLERDEQDRGFNLINTTGSPTIHAYLTTEDQGQRVPYYLCGNNLCYLADNPFYFQFDDARYLVMADLLHEFFQTNTPEDRKALLRFEDLAPMVCDTDLLRELADLFAERDIPFNFGVTPIFKDPEGLFFDSGAEFTLSDDQEFTDALNYLVDQGGTMVMHGVTHQHDNGISREDWEFSQGLSNVPLPYDSEDWVLERIESGLAEFAALGWRPSIWETPHFSASHGDYLVFADYFDTYYEKPLVFPLSPGADPVFGEYLAPQCQLIPFYCPVTQSGMGVLPDNMEYIDAQDSDHSPEALLSFADNLSIVRDGVASFFFHHDAVSREDLLTVVEGLQDLGYTFVSVTDFVDIGENPADDDTDDDTDDDDAADDDDGSDDDADGSEEGGCGC